MQQKKLPYKCKYNCDDYVLPTIPAKDLRHCYKLNKQCFPSGKKEKEKTDNKDGSPRKDNSL